MSSVSHLPNTSLSRRRHHLDPSPVNATRFSWSVSTAQVASQLVIAPACRTSAIDTSVYFSSVKAATLFPLSTNLPLSINAPLSFNVALSTNVPLATNIPSSPLPHLHQRPLFTNAPSPPMS
ncbi:hypothetical protein C1H76_7445 [Elsinoe australis]|uniref:Uncharacterized protein n=1 Tax=Elsinoe australis TaxID=40998 RepID=A0A4U7AR36_9PEZI|nr:hypothetical protein C1H76_7445 [Elsinoe australis]